MTVVSMGKRIKWTGSQDKNRGQAIVSTIYYYRSGGFRPPPDRELLEIDARGFFTMWRSIGWATSPPSAVGRFAGQLPPELSVRLNQIAQAVVAVGPVMIPARPDSPLERIEVEGVEGMLGIYDLPAGDWGNMVTQLREFLRTLTRFPRAALELETSLDGQHARLVQRGPEPLHLDFSSLTLRAVLRQGYHVRGEWTMASNAVQRATVEAESGWVLDLPFEHGFDVASGQRVVAHTNLGAYDGNQLTEVSLESISPPGA
jgi:hypothetical protein